ncbi:transglycosylase SLT domain-containing protein [Corynebacterium glucuronolyticum]|uniref:Transglycosylase SLT domain-containing protein n=1 Tax=Corynebacterium glucuronolyticum TaxID=39791 RepID=A0A7T4EDL1_9CORY|nr:transglycosylase SLT domain-containing protein [Corynebacterium glucuronolyticum]
MGAFGEGYTLAQAGPHHHHVHWAMTTNPTMPFDDGVFMEGAPIGDGATGGFGGWAASQIRKIWDGIMNPIKEKIPEFPGWFGQLPKTFFAKATGLCGRRFPPSSLVSPVVGILLARTWAGGSGVEQWRPLVEKILTDKGLSTALTDTVLRRMNQESGGNPGAQNNWDINAKNGVPSKGLMQVIGPTFQANKDPGFNDIWDPEANIRASMNYAIRRYGSLPAAYNRAGGYAEGGLIDLAKTMGALLFDRVVCGHPGRWVSTSLVGMSGCCRATPPRTSPPSWPPLRQATLTSCATLCPRLCSPWWKSSPRLLTPPPTRDNRPWARNRIRQHRRHARHGPHIHCGIHPRQGRE